MTAGWWGQYVVNPSGGRPCAGYLSYLDWPRNCERGS
jgi:hypothetical protein